MKQMTNVEFVQELMTFSRRGALAQLFVISAIEKYADAILASREEDWGANQMIDYGAWRDVAAEIKAKFRAYTGETENGDGVVQTVQDSDNRGEV